MTVLSEAIPCRILPPGHVLTVVQIGTISGGAGTLPEW